MQQHTTSESNGLGVAGFVVSLVGLVSCGLIAPIGAIMSAFAMKKEPKGLAIAGLVIGIIGSLWIVGIVILVIVFGGLAALLAAAGIAFGEEFETISETRSIVPMVEAYRVANDGQLPADVTVLPGYLQQDSYLDTWDNPYQIRPDGEGFTFFSVGQDGAAGTNDDIEGFSTVRVSDMQQLVEDLEDAGGPRP